MIAELGRHFRVVVVEMRGHGPSRGIGFCTLWNVAEDVLDVLKELQNKDWVEHVMVAGLSMGGMTALRVALLAPGLISRMVLLGCSARAETPWKRVQYEVMEFVVRRAGRAAPALPDRPDHVR